MSRAPAQRLITRLRAMGLSLPDDTGVRRTHAGHWQRAAGAWSWFCYSPTDTSVTRYGSQHPITALLREPRLVVTCNDRTREWSVDPYDARDQERAGPEGIYIEPERPLP